MSTPSTEPSECTWPLAEGCADLEAYDAAQVERAKILATAALRFLTVYRVGGCPRTVRPCAASCASSYGLSGPGFSPQVWAGEWVNNGCVCGPAGCGCSALSEVILPPPVGGVTEVVVDGQVVPPTAYRIHEGNRLVRVDGKSWPTCQDLALDETEVGTFAVTYTPGYPVDALGMVAMAVLTTEFAKALCGDKKCRLPSGVTSLTRAGITMEFGSDTFPNQRTGIREVDIFVQRWNPFGLRTAPRVLTPDIHKGRVVR